MASYTVNPGGGADYSSLQAWESDRQGDLVTAAEGETAVVAGSSADTGTLALGGWTTNATYYITIKCNDALGGKWNTSYYRLEMQTWNTVAAIDVSYSGGADHVHIKNLQVKSRNTGAEGIKYNPGTATSWLKIENCIFRNDTAGTTQGIWTNEAANGGTLYVWNTLVYDWSSGIGLQSVSTGQGSKYFAYNVGVHNCATGFAGGGNNAIVKNCWTMACTDGFSGDGFGSASDYNASDVASDAPGSNSQNGTGITFVNEGSDDFHLSASDTVAKTNGTNLSSDSDLSFTTDYEGTTRTVSWDIGPHEVSVSTPAVAQIGGRIHGEASANAEIGGRIDGQTASTNVTSEVGGRIEGIDSAQAEAGGRVHGIDQAAAEIGGRIQGVVADASEVGGRLHGVENAQSEVGGRIQGVDQSSAEVGGRIEGTDAAQAEIGGRAHGQDTANDEVGGRIQGVDQAASEAGGRIEGVAQASSEVGGRVQGVDQASAEIGGRVEGTDSANAEVGGRLHGQDTASSEVGGRVQGVDQSQAEIGGRIEGLGQAQAEVGGRLHGQAQDNSEIGGRVDGALQASAEIGGRIEGEGPIAKSLSFSLIRNISPSFPMERTQQVESTAERAIQVSLTTER